MGEQVSNDRIQGMNGCHMGLFASGKPFVALQRWYGCVDPKGFSALRQPSRPQTGHVYLFGELFKGSTVQPFEDSLQTTPPTFPFQGVDGDTESGSKSEYERCYPSNEASHGCRDLHSVGQRKGRASRHR